PCAKGTFGQSTASDEDAGCERCRPWCTTTGCAHSRCCTLALRRCQGGCGRTGNTQSPTEGASRRSAGSTIAAGSSGCSCCSCGGRCRPATALARSAEPG